jgi:hypothetical protein
MKLKHVAVVVIAAEIAIIAVSVVQSYFASRANDEARRLSAPEVTPKATKPSNKHGSAVVCGTVGRHVAQEDFEAVIKRLRELKGDEGSGDITMSRPDIWNPWPVQRIESIK